MKNDTLFFLLFLGLFLYINSSHNQSKHTPSPPIILQPSPSHPTDTIPQEPKRFYDSKYHSRSDMRINIPTRGEAPSYQQVGFLHAPSDSENIKPLYGRQTYPGSNHWNYFTSLDSHLATKIPITIKDHDCTDDR